MTGEKKFSIPLPASLKEKGIGRQRWRISRKRAESPRRRCTNISAARRNWRQNGRAGSEENQEERVARDVLVHDSPSEKMKAMIRLDLNQIRTFSGHFLTAFEANAVFSNEESSFLREISAILTYHNELILSIIEEGQKREEFRKIDPKFVATMLAGAFLSLQRAASDAKRFGKVCLRTAVFFSGGMEQRSGDRLYLHGIAC